MNDKITLVLDGQEYVDFMSIEVHISFLNVCREFQAQVSIPDQELNDYPIKIGQKFQVLVNGQKSVTGYIEKINIKQDGSTRTLTVYGRDYLADLVDSTIDASIIQPFSGNMSFAQVCRTVIAKLGLSVSVIDNSGNTTIFKKDDFISPDLAERCVDYLQKYADKVQVFVNSDGEGNLTIQRANDSADVQNFLAMQPRDKDQNRILESEVTYDNTLLFNQYRCHCQQQTLNSFTSQIASLVDFEDQVVGILGVARNRRVRASRIYNFISSASMDKQSATNRAIWQSNYNLSRYMCYKCNVEYFTYDSTNLWQPNQTVQVSDYYANINAKLLTSAVIFKSSVSDGNVTQLQFVPPQSFILQAERSEDSKQSQQMGKVYGSDQ
jgi:prophage tail gpP-like protein